MENKHIEKLYQSACETIYICYGCAITLAVLATVLAAGIACIALAALIVREMQ